jgi:hypothetical protein
MKEEARILGCGGALLPSTDVYMSKQEEGVTLAGGKRAAPCDPVPAFGLVKRQCSALRPADRFEQTQLM